MSRDALLTGYRHGQPARGFLWSKKSVLCAVCVWKIWNTGNNPFNIVMQPCSSYYFSFLLPGLNDTDKIATISPFEKQQQNLFHIFPRKTFVMPEKNNNPSILWSLQNRVINMIIWWCTLVKLCIWCDSTVEKKAGEEKWKLAFYKSETISFLRPLYWSNLRDINKRSHKEILQDREGVLLTDWLTRLLLKTLSVSKLTNL